MHYFNDFGVHLVLDYLLVFLHVSNALRNFQFLQQPPLPFVRLLSNAFSHFGSVGRREKV